VSTAILSVRGSLRVSKFTFWPLAQSINAGALERGGMDEYILIAIVRPNKAEASLIVEEFHGSWIHGVCPLKPCIGHSAHAVRGHFPAHRFWKAGLKRARPKRETTRPSCPANTDLKYVVVKRSTCKGAIAGAAKSSYPRAIACAPLGVQPNRLLAINPFTDAVRFASPIFQRLGT
jgi:hypothetical protein